MLITTFKECLCMLTNILAGYTLRYISNPTFEPPHDKTNKMTVRPAKTQITFGIRPVWSKSSLCALHSQGPKASSCGQRRLIRLGECPGWVFAGRTVTLLVLSWGGSFQNKYAYQQSLKNLCKQDSTKTFAIFLQCRCFYYTTNNSSSSLVFLPCPPPSLLIISFFTDFLSWLIPIASFKLLISVPSFKISSSPLSEVEWGLAVAAVAEEVLSFAVAAVAEEVVLSFAVAGITESGFALESLFAVTVILEESIASSPASDVKGPNASVSVSSCLGMFVFLDFFSTWSSLVMKRSTSFLVIPIAAAAVK